MIQAFKYRFGDAEFDESSMELLVCGVAIDLEPKPLDLLRTFLQKPGEVLTREELLDLVWPEQTTTEGVLSNAISKLRKALGDDLKSSVKTLSTIGYRFDAKVDRVASGKNFTSNLNYAVGEPVPWREQFVFSEQLYAANGKEVWRIENPKTDETRVVKFATSAAALSSLKREVTLLRLIAKAHPDRADFARLHDWNFTDSPIYIEGSDAGVDLKAWSVEGAPIAHMNLSERVAFAQKIAEAVASAHGIGILHKDLKPENIMVHAPDAGPPRPVVIDFGSGGVYDRSRLDVLGVTPIGITQDSPPEGPEGATLLYAAPELLQGASASISTDVFALGVLLYQIVSDRIGEPLTSGWEANVEDALLREDIAFAAHGDANLRLGSAEELANRLGGLEARRTIAAQERARQLEFQRGQGALSRARARRPWMIAAGLMLSIGVAASSMLYVQSQAARTEANKRAMQSEATAAFLQEVLLGADPRTPGAGPDASVRDALSRASASLDQRFGNDPEFIATVSSTLAVIYSGLADDSSAISAQQKVVRIYQDLYGDANSETLAAKARLAQAFADAGEFERAETVITEVRNSPAFNEEKLPEVGIMLSFSEALLVGNMLDMKTASLHLENATRLYTDHDITDLEMLHKLKRFLAESYAQSGRVSDAITLLEELKRAPFNDESAFPKSLQLEVQFHYASALAHDQQRLTQAIVEYLDLIDSFTELYGSDSEAVTVTMGRLGLVYLTLGEWEKANTYLSESRARECDTRGKQDINCLMASVDEATAQLMSGNSEAAEPSLRAALIGLSSTQGAESSPAQHAKYILSTALIDNGALDEAAVILQALDVAALAAFDPSIPWPVMIEAALARIEIRSGDRAGGLARLKSATQQMRNAGIADTIVSKYEEELSR